MALLATAIAALALSAAPAGAGAALPAPTDSPVLIRSLSPGTGADPAAEYVMLQMVVDGQGDLDGETLSFYGPGGSVTGTYVIPSDVANGQSHRTILLATPQRASEGGFPTPDFVLGTGDSLATSAGALCRTGNFPADCVSWGSFPAAVALALPDTQRGNALALSVLGRGILNSSFEPASPGCPTWMDPADDTGLGHSDFSVSRTPPAPRNNAAPLAVEEVPCVPDTLFNEVPANPTNNTTATFAFGEFPPEYGAHFECRFSPGPSMPGAQTWASCPPAGNFFPGLSDGTYSFQARAIGYAGTDPSPLHWTWEVDTVPPETTITQVPPNPAPGFSATFSFASSEPQSKFVCQFESGPVQTCESPKTLFGLSDGPHVFRVWAIDNATNKDPTPATHVFWVDTTLGDLTPPDTTILSRPPSPSQRPSASFTYRSSKPGSAFQCSLNGAAFAPCDPAGATYGRLANGPHSFAVRAIDRAGNPDPSPATYAWRVAAPLPKTTILRAPPGARRIKAKRTRVRFAFRSSPPAARYRCRLNKQRFRACRSPLRLRVGPGRHRFEVFAIDSLGNVEERPVRRIFRVLRRGRGLFG